METKPSQPRHFDADSATATDATVSRPGDLDLFAFGMMLLGNLRFILGCGLLCLLMTVGWLLYVKPRFSSTAVMLVPQNNTAASLIQSQIALNTLDMLGGAYELYADIAKSRTVRDTLIKNHDLLKVYGVKRMDQAETILANLTKVETSREGMIRITTEDTNPQRAADLANDYLHQLDVLNSSLVLSSASQKRAYLERELVKEKDQLADAEVALKEVQETTSGLPPEAAATAGMSALQTTRAQLRADQIYLAALLTGETEANPDVIRVRSEIVGLTSQLEALESGSSSAANGTPTSKLPQQALEYARRLREVKFHTTLFELIEKQFDAAKAQEAEVPSVVEVLDPAVPAVKKSWPPRLAYSFIAAVVGTLLGIFLVSLRAVIDAFIKAPQNQGKIQQLKASFGSARKSS
jgi:tyrosine-protein kinase Etk/Wzc